MLMKRTLMFLSRGASLAGVAVLLGIPAFADSLSFTATFTPTGGSYVGGAGTNYLNYISPAAQPEGLPVNVNGLTTLQSNGTVNLNFGKLQDVMGTQNGTVTSTFTITVTPTDLTTNKTLNSLNFYGTYTNSTGVFSFSTSSTTPNVGPTYTIPNYFGANMPETFIYETVGGFAFGIESGNSAAPLSGGKTAALYAYVSTPEPIPAATTGLAICILLGLAIRRKMQAF